MKVTTRAIVPLNDPPLRTLPMRSGLWLNIVKSPRLSRRYFSPTASSHSKQPESQNASVSSSVKEEQDDEDPPFALLSRRSLRLLKIVVTTAAGIACVFADYSEITEEHIFSGLQRTAKRMWRDMWSIDGQRRLELESKRKGIQESSSVTES